MNAVMVKEACEKHKDLVNLYFKNNGKKIRKMIDEILIKLKFNVENSDFYSLANEVFLDALCRYDGVRDFNAFLYSCFINKFKSGMTHETRDKRCVKVSVEKKDSDGNIIKDENGNTIMEKKIVPNVSIYTPIGDEDGNYTLGDTLASNETIETEIFKEEEEFRREVLEYLNCLSPLQKQIALLLSENNTPDEICEELHITMKHFENSIKRIFSDEKIKPLRVLVERN